MRQIVLDTETTGIGPEHGHRVIEIGCVELLDRRLTGKHYHIYLNPQREVDEGAFRVHGISTEFLQDKPLFTSIVNEFMAFIKGAELIIHNAAFDIGFLNAELKRIHASYVITDHCSVVDTLELARQKHPGQRNSLDALCKRYDINNSHRDLHGALLDAEILALVYLAMTGGQISLFSEDVVEKSDKIKNLIKQESLSSSTPIIYASQEEQNEHIKFIEMLVKKTSCAWFDLKIDNQS